MGRAALGHRKHVAGRLATLQFCTVCALRACDDSMRRYVIRRGHGHGELRSAGNYLTVDPPRYLASRPGGGAYEAAAAALASTPGGGDGTFPILFGYISYRIRIVLYLNVS